ncbi:MAG: amidohydrolase family protein, partial [Gemmatimonadaceae bacterium]
GARRAPVRPLGPRLPYGLLRRSDADARMIRYHARWVIPVAGSAVADGVVAVRGQRITYVGPRAGAPPGEDVDLGNVLLMPGLVNAHCHLELTAMRGFLEELEFGDWILRLATAKRAVLTSVEMLVDAATLGIAEGLRAGVTTYADTCHSGVVIDALRECGVRGVMYQEVFGPDPAQCATSLAELREQVAAARSLETPLVRVGVSPHAPYTVSDELYKAATRFALDERLPMALHIAEAAVESQLVERGEGRFADGLRARGIDVRPRADSSVGLLHRLGVLDASPLLIHCVRLSNGDVERIAATGSSVAHCPAANAKLGHGIAPVRELLDAGVRVGLGSDSVASNNRMDLLEEARLAALLQDARLGKHDGMTTAEALELATLGGAQALGLADRIGSLDPGKDADLAAFSLDVERAVPLHDPPAAALHALRGSDAIFVAVAGRALVRDGALTGAAADPELRTRLQAQAEALQEWLRAMRR